MRATYERNSVVGVQPELAYGQRSGGEVAELSRKADEREKGGGTGQRRNRREGRAEVGGTKEQKVVERTAPQLPQVGMRILGKPYTALLDTGAIRSFRKGNSVAKRLEQ